MRRCRPRCLGDGDAATTGGVSGPVAGLVKGALAKDVPN